MSAFKTVLITGASRGIGLGLTKHLLETLISVRVIATYRSEATASKLVDLAASYPKERLLLVQLDTTSAESYKSASAELTATGVTSLDILVANAGIASRQNTLTCAPADAMDVYNTNVVGSMLTVQAFHGLLTANKDGAKLTVFTSSIMGSIEKCIEMQGGAMAYRASKAALNMMAACYAEEQAHEGVKVLALHPGWVQTEMGNSGGRTAPVTVEDSVKGITQLLLTAAQVQQKSTEVATPAAYTAFENKFRSSNIVFTTFEGEILPW